MSKAIILDLEDFKVTHADWSKEFIKNTCLAHSLIGSIENKELYLENLKKNFFDRFGTIIMERLTKLPKVTAMLRTQISPGKLATLLERICNAVYRHYITDQSHAAVVLVSKKHLERLDISQAKFIRYSINSAPYFEDMLEIKVYHDGPQIILKFYLKNMNNTPQ